MTQQPTPVGTRWPRLRRCGALLVSLATGGLGLFGATAPAGAEVAHDHPAVALASRVQAVRQALSQPTPQAQADPTATLAEGADAPDPTVAQWLNWPNWGNWNNWPNWGNWGNWFNR